MASAVFADSASTTPAPIQAIVRKFEGSVSAADVERDNAVEKARELLLKELRVAQKTAMKQSDLPAANACEELIKSNDRSKKSATNAQKVDEKSTYGGTTWLERNGQKITFLADGTIQSTGDEKGHWHSLSSKSILVSYTNHTDWVRFYEFDEAGDSFKAMCYQVTGEYAGTRVK